jgi:uncharacterized membrane-anchored protein YhcB (DUF1043 family)/DNA-binding cell septation regulator SpoVG
LDLVLQIVLGILVLAGLVSIYLSTKYWHWSTVTIVSFIMIFGVVYLILAADTMRIHHNLRASLPRLETQLANLEQQNAQLLSGANDQLGIVQLEHRLRLVTRERGRAWRQVSPSGPLSPEGRLEVTIPAPTPHGLSADTIVYAFETGNANPNDPANGQQYLGEFRVVEVSDTGVVLESVGLLDQRTGERLARSQGPWSLYESMPSDRYKIGNHYDMFADMSEEELRKRLPESMVEEYVRHGQEATPNDDPRNVVGFDENDQRLPPDQLDDAVRKVFHRPLRDYAYLFSELGRQRVVLMAKVDAVTEDNAKLVAALESAEKLSAFREDQKQLMKSDLAGMVKDRQVIEQHLNTVNQQLENARKLITDFLSTNAKLADELAEQEATLEEMIDSSAPAPSATTISFP